MAIFTAIVNETITNEVRYTIEAETMEEAMTKAAAGDTVAEDHIKVIGVANRDVEEITEV